MQAANMNSTPDRGRTMAELTLTDEGEKGTGHGYFFHTQSIGTFYLLLAKSRLWNELRPTLTAIMANLAFAPQGVAAVQKQGQTLAAETPAVDGATLWSAALSGRRRRGPEGNSPCSRRPCRTSPCRSRSPRAGIWRGRKSSSSLRTIQTRTHGMANVSHTIIPMDMPVPGAINAPYERRRRR